ncbi:MAG: hypothetical protein PPFGHCPK_00784 [Spiroplasma endosymbiont of Drosophila atripex]|nr:MAG: hypothetical protein PPFGHCPK_00784 [Spiroplasma endosymbiont of Drosophila atripex]
MVFKVKKNKKVETIGKIDSDGFTIKHDGSDNIFIGTTNGTIYKYNTKEEEFTKIKQFNEIINVIEVDNDHNIYFGTWNRSTGKDLPGIGRVYKLEIENNDFSEIKGTSGAVWSLAIDESNNIYAGTTQGLFKINQENIFIKCPEKIPYQNPNVHTIRAILIDKEENIWIGTREGQHLGNIYRCKKGEKQFIRINEKSKGEVFTLAIDSKQNIYAGTWNNAGIGYFLQYYPKVNYFGTLANIPTNLGSIENIFINKNDDIFIGTRLGPDNGREGRLYKMKKFCI